MGDGERPNIAELLKPLGYATGQFGKNHLGDLNEYLPTVHGSDEFEEDDDTEQPAGAGSGVSGSRTPGR